LFPQEEELFIQFQASSSDSTFFKKEHSKHNEVSKVTDNSLLSSMMTRLTTAEKKLTDAEKEIKDKNKRIRILEEKCNIYKRAEGHDDQHIIELERKCYKLQRQIHNMEMFLEDYGMIWIGSGDEYDEVNDDDEDFNKDETTSSTWKPEDSTVATTVVQPFVIDFDLLIKNIMELNVIAGEGEHFIKHTKDGARLQIKESIPITFYANGIFMFAGPFRPYDEPVTQQCVRDMMDGYFPSELQTLYPDGVPFKIKDKRDDYYQNKILEKLFPGQGLSLSPQKVSPVKYEEIIKSDMVKRNILPNKNNFLASSNIHSLNSKDSNQNTDNFLSKLPSSVIREGRIVDIREGVKENLTHVEEVKNDVIVVETDVVKEMKSRLVIPKQNRPPTPGKYTTLRIKSENGNNTYVLKMKYGNTIQDVKDYLKSYRDDKLLVYDIKSSFPNRTYSDDKRTLKDYGLVPNATLHIVVRR